MKKEKTLSVAKQIELLQIVNGAGWMLAGVFCLRETILFLSLHVAAMFVSITSITYVMLKQKEEMDEMARENLYKAKASAHDIMHCVLCVAMILATLFIKKIVLDTVDWGMVLRMTFCMVIGFQNLVVGLTFRKLEAE